MSPAVLSEFATCDNCGARRKRGNALCYTCRHTKGVRRHGGQPNTYVVTGDQSWRDHAACQGVDTEIFYPFTADAGEQRRRQTNSRVKIAKRICADCPVAAECLRFALEVNDQHGIYGGTTPDDRKRMRRGKR